MSIYCLSIWQYQFDFKQLTEEKNCRHKKKMSSVEQQSLHCMANDHSFHTHAYKLNNMNTLIISESDKFHRILVTISQLSDEGEQKTGQELENMTRICCQCELHTKTNRLHNYGAYNNRTNCSIWPNYHCLRMSRGCNEAISQHHAAALQSIDSKISVYLLEYIFELESSHQTHILYTYAGTVILDLFYIKCYFTLCSIHTQNTRTHTIVYVAYLKPTQCHCCHWQSQIVQHFAITWKMRTQVPNIKKKNNWTRIPAKMKKK